ncbi:hypothetical protein Sa4125_28990 [Aureimonas sp. SA4125]|uniref:hypothetical protein n=1 Tax=Aureimonas sp. SA4125 TaxID=2826993 RepID=UPI001CC3CD50|nr:hypothetical protein [Aureimonas sp. SA4125]BDA85357.1 hypothetical protein Sa4125_28990 [Aureimonas sp. SA4125]
MRIKIIAAVAAGIVVTLSGCVDEGPRHGGGYRSPGPVYIGGDRGYDRRYSDGRDYRDRRDRSRDFGRDGRRDDDRRYGENRRDDDRRGDGRRDDDRRDERRGGDRTDGRRGDEQERRNDAGPRNRPATAPARSGVDPRSLRLACPEGSTPEECRRTPARSHGG